MVIAYTLEPTQGLYLNSSKSSKHNIFKSLEPTQGLYLNNERS